ncbi:hypothetical protein HAX54_005519 [Datura stramonium]|uniref:Uncharacterized protein n=1 Tax=Datura stramonium TaxID=4076 RepID=A0ABS8TAC0_DATST|nr:hypothetical protein [Datura stramonium]
MRIAVGRRTLTVLIKERSITTRKVAKSGESISGSKPNKVTFYGEKTEKGNFSSPRDRVKARLSSITKHPTTGKVRARSSYMIRIREAARKEFSIIAGECLSNAMLEEYEKIEKVSSIRQF